MSYQVLARSSRPQRFSEILGHEEVTATLRNAIRLGRVGHAYLFSGPRGVGKTSLARILAKALNCERGPSEDPCGACRPCQGIAGGSDIDVHEIDGASNGGIDRIRELRETVRYAPARGRFRIFIIDEVHQVSGPAFNALLKTLEEPPEHAKFILATTRPADVPETIRGRCQHFHLRLLPSARIAERIAALGREQGIRIEPEAARQIAARGRGSLRDALSILEAAISLAGGGAVTPEAVAAAGGAVPPDAGERLTDAVLGGDAGAALRTLAALARRGADPSDLLAAWTEQVRNLLVLAAAGDEPDLVDLPADDRARLAARAKGMPPHLLLAALQILSEARARTVRDEAGWIPAEAAAVALADLRSLGALPDLALRLEALERRLAGAVPAPPPPASPPPPQSAPARAPAPKAPPARPPAARAPAARPPAAGHPLVESIAERIQGADPKLAGSVRMADAGSVEGEALTLRFSALHRLQREHCQAAAPAAAIAAAAAAILGRPVRVEIEAGPAADAPAPGPAPAAEANPTIRLGADLLDARPVAPRPEGT